MRRALFVLLLVAAIVAPPRHAAAVGNTFVVNATGDANDANAGNGICFSNYEIGTGRELCHLRSAIHEANNNGNPGEVDRILFKIPGKGPHVITLGSDMHNIVEPVLIDGYTEPGSRKNTLAKGTNAKFKIIVMAGGNRAFFLGTNNSTIRGLSIQGPFIGLSTNGSNNRFEGNEVIGGSNMTRLDGPNNVIGGTSPAKRNRISGGGYPLVIGGASTQGNHVEGNLFGTEKDGKTANGNDQPIYIGTGAHDNVVGGTTSKGSNVIAFAQNAGASGINLSNAGVGNRILRNSIHSNASLGIDLGVVGPNANDAGDPDTGPNNLQNYPTLDSAKIVGDNFVTVGSLNSLPNTAFTIRFFVSKTGDPSGYGEGQHFLFERTALTDGSGDDAWKFRVPVGKAKPGWVLTATATNEVTGDTSEFSAVESIV